MGKCHQFQLVETKTTQNLINRLGRSFAITLIILAQCRGKKGLLSNITYKRRCRFLMDNCIAEKHRVVMWPFGFVHLLFTSTFFGCSFGNLI